MKDGEDKQVLVRMPNALLKRLDAEARKAQRPRAAEIRLRLAASFKRQERRAA